VNVNGLTVAVLAWNETSDLRFCFGSLQPLLEQTGAKTLVVFDPDGDAATLEVARELAGEVLVHPFQNFASQRNYALAASASRWVFFIDPDERMTLHLAREIAATLASNQASAYRVPRRNFLFGREVRHTGWYPDHQVRLLDTTRCRYDESREVHEFPVVDGEVGTLLSPLLHMNYRTWRQFVQKQLAYSGLHARTLLSEGRRATAKSLVGQPIREFQRRLIEYRGYRDGPLGISLAAAMSLYTLLVYVKLLRLQARKRG
jgi:glycosyltransferase involved in cell wall biosynthesis